MKRVIQSIIFLLLLSPETYSQITTPVIRANFGVDADLRSNYFNGFVQAGNDDWFTFPGSAGAGQFVIDTTGAAAITARYAIDIPFRRSTFARTLRYPAYSVVNNRLLLDAVFVRDFHGDDSTVFASGSNKNGDNPIDWQTPVSQGIPDKNDILDMMVHVRRAGPNITDSLWMFGGMSLDNTTGNRYFDFEMYQTDLTYDRPALKFYNEGPDMGHTSWQFDAAGNIIKPGDIIFSAEYQSSSLTLIEARIWINQSSLSITPAAFNWGGLFDGAYSSAPYGYASIQPKTGGAYYTGLQCGNNTWGGPFSIILQNEAIVANYSARQYVEFSVNLTKLGLDPVTSLSGDGCAMPFRRILVKTRASASFTAELKDFVAPFAFFDLPKADIQTLSPTMCNQGSVAEIHVTNPLSTSLYQWTTPNGNIISSPSGQSILVDTPGTYIVTQYLFSGCSAYASDTVQILPSNSCFVLPVDISDFKGNYKNNNVDLSWKVLNNQWMQYLEVQRSEDGLNFITVSRIDNQDPESTTANYSFADDIKGLTAPRLYYRIKIAGINSIVKYSGVIILSTRGGTKDLISIFPNPVRDIVQVQITSTTTQKVRIDIFDASGKLITSSGTTVQRGNNVITLTNLVNQPRGVYLAVINAGDDIYRQKLLLTK